MHVAYLVNQYPQPSQSFIRREIAALESLGHRVSRFTLRPFKGALPNPDDERERERTTAILARGAAKLAADVNATALSRPAAFAKAAREAWRASRFAANRRYAYGIYLAEACALRRMVAECGATHVHAHFGTNSAEVARLCRLLGGPPYSFTVHGPEEFDNPVGLDLGGKVRHSQFAVAISSFGRSQLWRWTDFDDWDKVQVVRCGVDASFISDDAPPPVDEASRSFTCVGRLAEQKGQLVLVRAAKLLMDRGIDFRVDLLGEGPLRPALEAEIRKHGLGERVILHGLASGEDVRRHMLAGRATVLPSFAEGLPVVLMESLALARPCVATSVAGIPELATPQNGWVVPPADAQRLADAMAEALAAPASRLREMGDLGRAAVRDRHDAVQEARRLADLIEGHGLS